MFYLYRVIIDEYISYVITDDWDFPNAVLVDIGDMESLKFLRQALSTLANMERRCIEAYRAGQSKPIQDIIDKLKGI